MPTLLSLMHVSVGYPDAPILSDVSLDIRSGDAFALFGPNGSGKTTLLKTMAGILPPLAGTIHFLDEDNSRGRVGYVPQRAALQVLLPLSVEEVVLMGTYGSLKPWQGVGKTQRDRANWALDTMGMSELAGTRYATLSGGQQQRVLIARALAASPHVLILDEPMASLDTRSADQLAAVLNRLKEQSSVAILWADHMAAALRSIVKGAIWIEGTTVTQGPLEGSPSSKPVRVPT